MSQSHVKILEQPAKALRFRYECEGRSAGSIPGARSTANNKTFPSIRVVGHKGEAVVVVSCVTNDFPHKPHPHNLVGKDCKTGVCTAKIIDESMTITFSYLGIQCVKKKDVLDSLKIREKQRVDPFKTGFSHRDQPSSIDLNAVRLCFQVFVPGAKGMTAIRPVVSEPIYDKKSLTELKIFKLSDCTAPATGGKEIILLCEKVVKEDIAIKFYEEENNRVTWQAKGKFRQADVHRQFAIAFRTPEYKNINIDRPVKVFVQLHRPSDGFTSEPIPFEFVPSQIVQRNKRPRIESIEIIQNEDIKQEPIDNLPAFNLFGGYRVQYQTPSPHTFTPIDPIDQQMNIPIDNTLDHRPPQTQIPIENLPEFTTLQFPENISVQNQNVFAPRPPYHLGAIPKQPFNANSTIDYTNLPIEPYPQHIQEHWNIATASTNFTNTNTFYKNQGISNHFQTLQPNQSDFIQIDTGDLLPNGQQGHINFDPENISDSFSKLRLDLFNEFETP